MIAKNTLLPTGGQVNYSGKFNRVPEELFDFVISDGAFKLYVLMLSYGWFKPECWTAKEELARRMHRSTRQISRLLRELEEAELIAIQPPTTSRATNTYHLKLWTPPQPGQPAQPTPKTAGRKTIRNYGGFADGTVSSPNAPRQLVKNKAKKDKPQIARSGLNLEDNNVTPTKTNPSEKGETNLSSEVKDSELNNKNNTKKRVCGALAVKSSQLTSENTGKNEIANSESITRILVETGISRLRAAEIAEIAQKNGRSVTDIEALIRSVRKNSRIENVPAYILRMVELDSFSSNRATVPKSMSLNKPFVKADIPYISAGEPLNITDLWEKVCKVIGGKFNKPDLATKISSMSVNNLENKVLSIKPQEAWQKRTISQADLALLEMVLSQVSRKIVTNVSVI